MHVPLDWLAARVPGEGERQRSSANTDVETRGEARKWSWSSTLSRGDTAQCCTDQPCPKVCTGRSSGTPDKFSGKYGERSMRLENLKKVLVRTNRSSSEKKPNRNWATRHAAQAISWVIKGAWTQKRLCDVSWTDSKCCKCCQAECMGKTHRLYHCSEWRECGEWLEHLSCKCRQS